MISLVRKSTKYLIIETYDLAAMEDYLITSLKAFKDNIYTVSAKTNEDYTVIYITDDINKPSVISEESPVYMLPQDLDHILCRIVNEKNNHLIKSLKLAPRLLIFRYFGNRKTKLCKVFNIFFTRFGKVSSCGLTAAFQ